MKPVTSSHKKKVASVLEQDLRLLKGRLQAPVRTQVPVRVHGPGVTERLEAGVPHPGHEVITRLSWLVQRFDVRHLTALVGILPLVEQHVCLHNKPYAHAHNSVRYRPRNVGSRSRMLVQRWRIGQAEPLLSTDLALGNLGLLHGCDAGVIKQVPLARVAVPGIGRVVPA